MLVFPKLHFLWNMGKYLWFLQCCGLCCFPPRAESGSGIVPTSLVSLLTSAQVRLYRASCPVAEAQGEGGVVTGLVGSPSLCSPGSLVLALPGIPTPLFLLPCCDTTFPIPSCRQHACTACFSWVVQVSQELSAVPPRNRNFLMEQDCSTTLAGQV